jgi:hypothetical protein
MQQESEKEAMGKNIFKINNLCIAGEKDERQPVKTITEEKKAHTLLSS